MQATLKHIEEWASPRTVIVLTLLLLGALWSALIVSAVSTRQESIDNTGERLQRMTRAVEEQVRQEFRLADTVLASCARWLVENPQRDARSDPDFRKLIEGFRRRTGDSIDIYLLAADGQLFDILANDQRRVTSLADHDLVAGALASSRLFIGRPLRKPSSDQDGLPIALALQRPVHGIRMLLAMVDLRTLSDAYEEQRPQPGGAITLLRRDGMVLATAPQPAPAVDESSARLLQEDLASRPRGLLVNPAGTQTREFISYSAMPDLPLVVMVSEDYDIALAPWLRQTLWVILLGIGVTVPLAVVAYRSLRLLQLLANQHAQLEKLATTDRLTGASSRQHFVATLEEQLARARAEPSSLTVLLFDIDFFKRINDGYGHAVGDQALVAFAEVATRCLREGDLLGRLGASEFSMLLPNTDADEGLRMAERVRSEIAAIAIPTDNGIVQFSASVGASEALPTDQSADDLLKRATRALHDAKASGHDRVALF